MLLPCFLVINNLDSKMNVGDVIDCILYQELRGKTICF